MAFKDLLVPKWKHSSCDVRLAAIDTISNDVTILREIAETDSSSHVRIAAIKKIGDEQLLSSLIGTEKDEQVLDAAKKQRESILKRVIASSKDQQTVINALLKYGNEKLTASYLCDHQCDLVVQQTLIGHISNHQLLSKITEHECAFEIAEKIVGQITEKALLERIAQKASNKKIRTIAQEKIDTLFADPHAVEREVTRKLQQCCTGMDIRVTPQNYDQAVALLDISRSIWNKYDPHRMHPLAQTYAAAEKCLLDKIELARSQKNILDSLEMLSRKAEQLISQPADTLQQQYEQLLAEWNAVDRSIINDIPTILVDDRFKTACAKIHSALLALHEASEQLRHHQESLEQACCAMENFVDSCTTPDEKVWRRLRAHWDSLNAQHAPDDVLKKRIADVEKKYREKIDAHLQLEKRLRHDEVETVERLVADMESLAASTPQQMRSRHQQVVQLKQEWEKSPRLDRKRKTELQSRFLTAYDTFIDAYHELKEQSSWQQWAGEHVKSKILDDIEQLEARIAQGEPLNKISRKVSLYENKWRQALGGENRTPEMDDRFFATRDRILGMAVTKKSELLETLKTIVAAPADGNLAEAVKAVQKQWNDIGYLPPELEKDTPDLFYGLCNAFFAQRKEHFQKYSEDLEKNSAIREEICNEAEKLSDATDWKATKDAFSQLQNRWDESWPAPHKRSRELWLRFNKSREHFFERYHAFQSENDKLKEELIEKAEKLLSQLHEDASMVNTVQNEAVKLQKVWKESGPASMERSEELWERFNSVQRQLFAIIDEEQGKNLELKEQIVKEAESIASSVEWDAASLRFQELRTAWKEIKPAGHRDVQALWKRLQAAGDTFFGRRKAHFDTLRNSVRQKIEEKEKLLADMEMLVRISGKSHLLTTAQNQSSAEILKKGIDMRNQLVVDGDPEKTYDNIKKRAFAILDIWDNGEQLSGRAFQQLDNRLDELVAILKKR